MYSKDWPLYTILVLGILILVFSFINFFNSNAGAITAIFTGVYVLGTFLMWWEMRLTRQSIDEPRLQISFVPRRVRHLNVLDMVIENIGNVPIANLDLDFYPTDLKNTYGRKLAEIFKDKSQTLAKSGTLKMIMFRDADWGKISQIRISAKYASLYNQGVKRSVDFSFDMANFNFTDMPYEYGNEDFINELRHIKGAIDALKFPLE